MRCPRRSGRRCPSRATGTAPQAEGFPAQDAGPGGSQAHRDRVGGAARWAQGDRRPAGTALGRSRGVPGRATPVAPVGFARGRPCPGDSSFAGARSRTSWCSGSPVGRRRLTADGDPVLHPAQQQILVRPSRTPHSGTRSPQRRPPVLHRQGQRPTQREGPSTHPTAPGSSVGRRPPARGRPGLHRSPAYAAALWGAAVPAPRSSPAPDNARTVLRPVRLRAFAHDGIRGGHSNGAALILVRLRPHRPRRLLHRPTAGSRASGRHSGGAALLLAALGIVFGDIGTSPLYALQTVFSIDGGTASGPPRRRLRRHLDDLLVGHADRVDQVRRVIMRADNDGEGGVMALAALARRLYARPARRAAAARPRRSWASSLFYGDSLITPAISVLSAVEGLEVAAPGARPPRRAAGGGDPDRAVRRAAVRHRQGGRPVRAGHAAVVRRAGRRRAARGRRRTPACCGPVPHLRRGVRGRPPLIAFVAMGAVVLVITGAEALYADMGHFGRPPIRAGLVLRGLPRADAQLPGPGVR